MEEDKQAYISRLKEIYNSVVQADPLFEPLLGATLSFTMHQDSIPELDDEKLRTIGAAIKAAGLIGTEVHIVGRCGERKFRD